VDAVGHEGVHAPGRHVLGLAVGDDHQRNPGRTGRAIRFPARERGVVGPPPADHRPHRPDRAGEDRAVAVVVAERPLVDSFTTLAQRLLRSGPRRLHEPVQRHAHVVDHLAHRSAPRVVVGIVGDAARRSRSGQATPSANQTAREERRQIAVRPVKPTTLAGVVDGPVPVGSNGSEHGGARQGRGGRAAGAAAGVGRRTPRGAPGRAAAGAAGGAGGVGRPAGFGGAAGGGGVGRGPARRRPGQRADQRETAAPRARHRADRHPA
jgi:hypothetical protein